MRFRLGLASGCQNAFRISAVAVLFLIVACSIPAFAQEPEQESTKKQLKNARKEMRRGELDASEAIVKSVLASEPGHVEATLDLSYVYLKKRNLLDSHDLAFEIAKSHPENSYAFAILGTVHLMAGNFAESRTLLVNSLNLDKETALAWASLGMLEFYENRIREGILNLEEAVFHDSDEPDFVFALAQVRARGERYKEAAASYDRFLRIAPKTDVDRRERIRGLIRFLKFLGKRHSLYDLGGEDSTKVKAELVNNRPVIQVRLSKGGDPLNFVLDTGSGMTVLSEATAKKYGIRTVARGGRARAIGGDGTFEIVYGFLDSIRIGEIRVKNVPVYIRKFQETSTPIDGYIGLSVISKYVTTLDYGKNELTLVSKKSSVDMPPERDSLTIPLRLTSSGFLSGKVQLSGVETNLHFILDTGASVSVVSEQLAATDPVKNNLVHQRMRVIGAAGITEDVPLFMLKDFSFGGAERAELRAVALNLALINETAGFEQAGILGGNFLKDYRLTFDFKRSFVTLVPN